MKKIIGVILIVLLIQCSHKEHSNPPNLEKGETYLVTLVGDHKVFELTIVDFSSNKTLVLITEGTKIPNWYRVDYLLERVKILDKKVKICLKDSLK